MEIACSLNYHCILRNRQMVRGTPKETHGWRGGGSRGSLLTAPYPQTDECGGASIPPVHGLDRVHDGLVPVYCHRHQRQTGGVHCHLKKSK